MLFKDLFFEYWKNNNQAAELLFNRLLFRTLYRNIQSFQENLKKLPQYGDNRHLLNSILFKEINQIDSSKLEKDIYKIYKLTYKFKAEKANKQKTYFREYF